MTENSNLRMGSEVLAWRLQAVVASLSLQVSSYNDHQRYFSVSCAKSHSPYIAYKSTEAPTHPFILAAMTLVAHAFFVHSMHLGPA